MVKLVSYKGLGLLESRSDRDRESKHGLMGHYMKVGGETIRPMAKVDSSMPMEISTMVFGRTIRRMALVFTVTWTVQDTRDTGRKTSSTDKGLRHGQMELVIKEIMLRERSTALVSSLGLMEAPMTVNSMKITLRDKEFINGQTAETTKVSGRTIKWKAMEYSHGPMAEDMRVSISMIKRKVTEYFTGKSIWIQFICS